MSEVKKTQQANSIKVLQYMQFGLTEALITVILVACLIVATGYYMYLQDPNKKYDLARPGAKDNQSLRVDDEADTTSPVSADSTQKKIEYLKKEVEALNGVNKFELEDISDQNIQLAPNDQPSH